jgi:hypothetical protein
MVMTGYLRLARAPGCRKHRRGHQCLLPSKWYASICSQARGNVLPVSEERLASTVELAELLGVTRQRVDQLARAEGFPAPAAELAIGRVWDRTAVIEWAKAVGRLPADFKD